jgi:hypothetical protein
MLELAGVRSRLSAAGGELQAIRASPLRDRPGRVQHASALEQEIARLEARDSRIEADLEEVSHRLSASAVASQAPPPALPPIQPGFPDDAIAAIGIVAVVVFLAPISLAIARLIWKYGTAVRSSRTGDSETRLDRVDQSLDAIAVEVERIAEGQRYVTRLLSESPNFAVDAARARAPEAVPRVSTGKSTSDGR